MAIHFTYSVFAARAAIITIVVQSMPIINLLRGHPNRSLLATNEMRQLLSTIVSSSSSSDDDDLLINGLQYGDEAGNPGFLNELASFLERQCVNDDLGELEQLLSSVSSSSSQNKKQQPNKKQNRLFATMGVSHSLDLVCATHTQPGDVVLVECPTYFLVRGIFQNHQLQIQSLPMHSLDGGVDVDRLVEDWDTGRTPPPRMIYIIPTHQNPTGHTMPIQDRIQLTLGAIRHGVLVVADEVYHCLDWRDVEKDGPRPARMAELSARLRPNVNHHDDDANSGGVPTRKTVPSAAAVGARIGGCVSVSSFTKIFGPGIRCGWIEAAPDIIDRLIHHGFIQSQGGCGPWVGEIMRLALAHRLTDAVVERLQHQCQARATKLCQILSGEPRIQLTNRPLGGYFVWIRFPNTVKTDAFQAYCTDRIKFLPGARCDVIQASSRIIPEGSFDSYARLCFADLDEEVLEDGVNELVACFQEYMLSIESDPGAR